jgi:cytochrome P450
MGTTADLVYNPYAFSLHEDPYETYRRLRDDAPAYWNPELAFWTLSRFADVQAAFKDFETYSSANGIALEARGRVSDFPMMITLDPPEHTVMRKLVNRVFTPRQVAALEAETRGIVNGYLDQIVEAGSCDLVAELTGPFPMDVISAVLGVPPVDRPELRAQADRILIREDGSMDIPDIALEGFAALIGYFAEELPQRRQGRGAGLVTDLANLDVEGRRLTDEEVLAFCILFIIAGHETTTKMVANAIEVLSRHPDQRDRLVAEPALVPDAIEEVLRFHNSTQYMHRTLTRDEREFGPTAGEFDIGRGPQRHISFGYGAHYCLGAGLARMEGRVALEEIHRRIPDYAVDHERKVRFHSGNVTGWTRLPVSFSAPATVAVRV